MTAMTAATLDQLSGGRFLLGIGSSGPQVAEGWHGQRFARQLQRTREYVDVVRMALRRERVAYDGETLELPLPDGPGKALKLTIAPVQERIPIYIAAIGPKNTTLTAEIADGWIPTLFSPEHVAEFRPLLEEGFARAGGGKGFADFDIAPTVNLFVSDDRDAARDAMRPFLALYVGGMGSRKQNFYNQLVQRYGFEDAARTRAGPLPRRPQGRGGRRAAGRADRRGLARAARPTWCASGSPCSATPASGTLMVSPMAWTFEDRRAPAAARSPSWPGDPARATWPSRAGRSGRRAGARRARRRLRRDLPRLGAAGLGAAAARPGARPLARPDHRRLVVDARRRRAGRPGRRARLLHPGRRAATRRRRRRSRSALEPIPGRAHVSAVFTHPDRWREGIAAAMLADARGRDARRRLPRGRSSGRPEEAPARRFYEATGWRHDGREQWLAELALPIVAYVKPL